MRQPLEHNGQQFTNADSWRSAKAMSPAKPMAHEMAGGDDQGQEQGQDIENDPQAMQAVDVLKQKGYTPEQVAQAMQDDGGQEEQPEPWANAE